ncbi:MAG TPA: ROK family protein [Phycisphaerae bacterium]|nr:ROK family protein [Phycisphaerae bacterium]
MIFVDDVGWHWGSSLNLEIFTLDSRERELLRIIWVSGRLSRWELHERSGQTPNGVGIVAGRLLEQGILRECPSEPSGGGRPRIPLEIDPAQRHVVGLMILPNAVEICRMNLYGNVIGKPQRRSVLENEDVVSTGARMLQEMVSRKTLSVGIGIAGLMDQETHSLMLNAAASEQRGISLQPLYEAIGECPFVLVNNLLSLAARWALTHRAEFDQDVLLVAFGDAHLGAAMLIQGKPNRGCMMGANELGHTRLPVETEVCFCGHTGCLERICSSSFLHSNGVPANRTLQDLLSGEEDNAAVEKLIELLSMGIANGVNFVRPHRLVLVSDLTRSKKFDQTLMRRIDSMLLPELATRVRIDAWDIQSFNTAETAGWTALAGFYSDSWEPYNTTPQQKIPSEPVWRA